MLFSCFFVYAERQESAEAIYVTHDDPLVSSVTGLLLKPADTRVGVESLFHKAWRDFNEGREHPPFVLLLSDGWKSAAFPDTVFLRDMYDKVMPSSHVFWTEYDKEVPEGEPDIIHWIQYDVDTPLVLPKEVAKHRFGLVLGRRAVCFCRGKIDRTCGGVTVENSHTFLTSVVNALDPTDPRAFAFLDGISFGFRPSTAARSADDPLAPAAAPAAGKE